MDVKFVSEAHMKRLISPDAMRACEKEYFETSGVSSLDMMERAAAALAEQAESMIPAGAKIFVACGPSGNGGDGYACARMLHEKGFDARVFPSQPPRSRDAIVNRERAAGCGVGEHAGPSESPALWIDCLYGTGLSRCPEGAAAELIARMNADGAKGSKVLAADIPSGLNGTTGRAFDVCVRADATVSFQFAKYGHVLGDGLDVCGELITADIGFPESAFPDGDAALFEAGDIPALLPARRRNLHKGDCGHLLVVAGSCGMAGAAALCAGGALRTGAGLVTIACPESIVPILQTLEPCAMCIPLPEDEGGALSIRALEPLVDAFKGKTAVACGCGWTRRVLPDILKAVLDSGLPAVIDADALNILSEHPELLAQLKPCHVLTPHPGEAARLLGQPVDDPVRDAGLLSRTGACVVLKGAASVIAQGDSRVICAQGSSAMARGGSGDILTGMTGALLCDRCAKRTVAESAALACALHGIAGEFVEARFGLFGAKAQDQLDAIPEVFKAHDR